MEETRGVTEDLSKRDANGVFEDRKDAALQLADLLSDYSGSNAIVLAMPPGGVDIGVEVARLLFLRVDALVVKEIVSPEDPKVAYGAMAPDEITVIDDTIDLTNVPEDVYRKALERARQSVAWREDLYRRDTGGTDVKGRTVILIADGIRRPACALAAIKYLRKKGVSKVVVGAATATARGLEALREKADDLRCVNVHYAGEFTVEAAFRTHRPVKEEEAALIMRTLS